MTVVADLASLAIFADLPPEQVERLAKYAEELDVPQGTELTHEGRHEGPVYAVISGYIGIDRGGKTVDTIGPGGFLGEIAAVRDIGGVGDEREGLHGAIVTEVPVVCARH